METVADYCLCPSSKSLSLRLTVPRFLMTKNNGPSIIFYRIYTLLTMLLMTQSSSSSTTTAAFTVQFRTATPNDVFAARKILFKEAMNPLSISQERLLVAYDTDSNNMDEDLVGFGQIRLLDESYSELASLFVLPNFRNIGIGGSIVEQLLKSHDDKQQQPLQQICLLTLRPTTTFYSKYGFKIIDSSKIQSLPKSIQLEYSAGSIVSTFLGNDIVCMIRS